ncbi:hypothetical protein [Niallia sp. 03133]|uniref:hypothetical protein n=1 Tax=Niallia sp. 03133 TaxID=3458060 RepID=UPI0040441D1E
MKQFVKKISFILVLALALNIFLQSPFTKKAEAATKYTYYIKSTANLYSSTKSNKKKLKSIPINTKLTTTTSKKEKMYKVTYDGKTGYVYASKFSTKLTTLTFYVKDSANLYDNTSKKQKKVLSIPINAKLTTQSVVGSKMYKVSYNGKSGYIYSSKLAAEKVKSVPFGKTVQLGNFTVKIDKPINEFGEGYVFEGENEYIALPVTTTNYGDREYIGWLSEGYVDDEYYDVFDNAYGAVDYVDNDLELDPFAKLSKGKSISGYITLLMSPGKKLEFVYEDIDIKNTITFTGEN